MGISFDLRVMLVIRLVIIASILLSLHPTPGHADMYSWVDDQGVTHFTDDPHKVPKDPLRSASRTVDDTEDHPNIAGRWTNRQSSFSGIDIIFNTDRTGIFAGGVMGVKFDWSMRRDGRIVLELHEPTGLGGKPSKETVYMAGKYDPNLDVIIMETKNENTNETRTVKFFPAEYEKRPARIHAPKWIKFSDSAVDFPSLGIMSIRNLSLPQTVVPFKDTPNVLLQLKAQPYGGHSDWRLPTYDELEILLISLKSFVADNGPRNSPKGLIGDLEWIGFIEPKGICYWTSTKCDDTNCQYAFSLKDGTDQMIKNPKSCGVWAIRGEFKRKRD